MELTLRDAFYLGDGRYHSVSDIDSREGKERAPQPEPQDLPT